MIGLRWELIVAVLFLPSSLIYFFAQKKQNKETTFEVSSMRHGVSAVVQRMCCVKPAAGIPMSMEGIQQV